jgi:hypothetical protein
MRNAACAGKPNACGNAAFFARMTLPIVANGKKTSENRRCGLCNRAQMPYISHPKSHAGFSSPNHST